MEPTSPGHISSHDAIIPWSKLQAEAIVHVNDVMEGRVAQRRTVHELPPRPPERGCGRWLRDSYPVATPKTNEEKAKEEKGSLKKTIQPNTLICQRLAKAASVQRLASIAASQLIPPVPTRQLDQQEYEARVALDTLSVLIGARKVEFEPNGGRRNSFRTRVREQDPSFDIQEARGIFLDITKILMPYLVKGKYSLSHLTVMFQCVNSLRLDPDDFSRSALSQAADLISHASNQLSTSINSGAYCTFLQSISHSSSKRIYHMSSAETKKKIESSSDWFCQRMSARQVAVAYSCFVKLDAVSWESSLVALLTSNLRSSDWTREPDSLVQIWASFGSQLRGSAGQHPQSISTNFAKILLSHLESTSNGGSLSLHQMLTSLANSVTIFRRLGIHPSTEV